MCEELSWQTRLSQAYGLDKNTTMTVLFTKNLDTIRMVKLDSPQTLLLLALEAELDVDLSSLLISLREADHEHLLAYHISTDTYAKILDEIYNVIRAWLK